MTGALRLAVGSEGSPGLVFTGDTDTGFYWVGANQFAASAGGVRQGTWSTSGLSLRMSTAAAASFNIPAGTTPTSPVDGDIWSTAVGLFVRVNGVTVGPIGQTAQLYRSARTSNTVLGSADRGTFIDITANTFTQTFTSAATLGNGWWCYVQNSGDGAITLPGIIDGLTSYIMYPGECRLVMCDGSAFFTSVTHGFEAVFAATGTFMWPPGYESFKLEAWGGGGGGASGMYQGGGTFRGGAPGGGGAYRWLDVLSSTITPGASVALTIGASGAGGAFRTTTGDGLAGSPGGTTAIGSLLTGLGGHGGIAPTGSATDLGGLGGGWIPTGTGTSETTGDNATTSTPTLYGGGQGGTSTNGSAPTAGYGNGFGGAGGGAGGRSSNEAGADGGSRGFAGGKTGGGGAGGAAATAGAAGSAFGDGGGGGGGSNVLVTPAGNGGAGATAGGGGGGGGVVQVSGGSQTGSGGPGGSGYAIIRGVV